MSTNLPKRTSFSPAKTEIAVKLLFMDTSVEEYLEMGVLGLYYGRNGFKTRHIEKYEKHTYP